MKGTIFALIAWLLAASITSAEITKQVVRIETAGPSLLKEDGWRATGSSRRDGAIFVCDNGASAPAESGFTQSIILNQTTPQPIIATAWSKAEGVGGSRDSDYSLYLDIIYTDGQPLWGQIAPFKVGNHDWQKAEVRVFPSKPVKEVHYHLLCRRHAGKAIFREPRLYQAGNTNGGLAWFDGVLVAAKSRVEGFQVRDVAADSDFVTFENGRALGLKLDVERHQAGAATLFTAQLSHEGDKDRAVTLVYTLPAGPDGWRWLANARREEPAKAPSEYLVATHFAAGSNGLLSRYPLAAIAREDQGKAIALDMARPAFFRVGYSAGTGELYIAFDLALTKEQRTARVGFCTFPFAGAAGFRGAVARLYEIYPDHFRSRTPQQGVWMPFNKISSVEGWEDFGFKFKEGDNETSWDDAHGIITFRYTEPMTWWMTMAKGTPRTLANALAEARRMAEAGNKDAQALLTSGYHDEDGQFAARMLDTPWCDGAVWSMNSSPGISGQVTDFKNKWNPQLRDKLYGKSAKATLDGEYIDSSEGYVTDELDFRRDHFAAAQTPLTFATDSHKPAIFRGLIACEYARGMAQDVHGMGRLMMANATPDRLCWLAPWLDVLGTETDWNPGNTWRPMSDEELLYRRVICGPKPYCFLMNTRFDQFSHELVEKFMKRCLAYGMFPGFFSHNAADGHYFSQPGLYNRDRDLFRKYVPLCKLVAEAGWRPVTGAASSEAKVHVERFGEKYLTVFNDSGQRREVTIRLSQLDCSNCRNLVTGQPVPVRAKELRLSLDAEDIAVLAFE